MKKMIRLRLMSLISLRLVGMELISTKLEQDSAFPCPLGFWSACYDTIDDGEDDDCEQTPIVLLSQNAKDALTNIIMKRPVQDTDKFADTKDPKISFNKDLVLFIKNPEYEPH